MKRVIRAAPDVGLILREMRRRRGLSQKALSEMAQVPQSNISNLERGVSGATVHTLLRLAGALNLEISLGERPAHEAGFPWEGHAEDGD